MMELVPFPLVRHEFQRESGLVTLQVPRFREPVLGRIFQKMLPPERKFVTVTLEKRGSYLWRAMDGHRSLGLLTEILRKDFPEDCGNIHERTAIYFTSLYQNKFIEFLKNDPKGR